MPMQDKTGPAGEGPMTGRGLGKCVSDKTGRGETSASQKGLGRCINRRSVGRGSGRGLGRRGDK